MMLATDELRLRPFSFSAELNRFTAMPFFLVIILAPKVAFLNENGDVIVRRTNCVTVTSGKGPAPIQPSSSGGLENIDGSNVPSMKGIALNPPETLSSGSSTELESLEGDALMLDETELTEINIRGFIASELEKLYTEYVICAHPTLVEDETGNALQATCICERDSVDTVMARLAFYGVGNLVGSINVLSLESSKFFRVPKPVSPALSRTNLSAIASNDGSKHGDNDVNDVNGVGVGGSGDVEMGSIGSSPEKFVEAAAAAEAELQAQRKKTLIGEVASQIRVEQVVEAIEGSATMDFDYIALLTIASVIGGVGLATNNSVSIVASMLVSPLMGPVMACTFGTMVNKWSLVRLGVWSELCSLLLCIVVGFCVGLVTMAVGTKGSWPTVEMRTRGYVDSLLLGVALAVPSGAGVAISMLSNNINSLVGVAISAALVAPAVNCGLCLSYAAAGYTIDPGRVDDVTENELETEYLKLGGISLALTVVNIGAIYVAGCLMFRLKEVAPLAEKQAFWQRDTHYFRQLMQSSRSPEPASPTTDSDSQRKLPFDRYDLKAQVRMLREVEKDPQLREQLHLEIDDVDLSSPVVGNYSRMSLRKPRTVRNVKHKDRGDVLMDLFRSGAGDTADHALYNATNNSQFRTHHYMQPATHTNTQPTTHVDTSSIRTAPSHMYQHTASYAPHSTHPDTNHTNNTYNTNHTNNNNNTTNTDTRPESVAAIGHSGTTGTLGIQSAPFDMSVLKARLRKEGKSVRVGHRPHK